jgi:histidine triad (HIT) family protein
MTDVGCVFCSITAGEADALIVDERERTLAFSPLQPLAPGHALVVPKAHHESLFDVPPDVLADVMTHVRSLARRLRGDGGFDGVNVINDSTEYQSVPHLHMHLVGRHEGEEDLFPEPEYDGSKRDAYDAVVAALDDAP